MTADGAGNREQLIDEAFEEFVNHRIDLSDESDRGCALLAAAYLDHQLAELVRSCLIDDEQALKGILVADRPLGAFNARIEIACLMGRIDSNTRRDLQLIRRIRNDFAHNLAVLTFNSDAIRNRCRELRLVYNLAETPRHLLCASAAGINGQLTRARIKATRPQANESTGSLEEQAAMIRDVLRIEVEGTADKSLETICHQRSFAQECSIT